MRVLGVRAGDDEQDGLIWEGLGVASRGGERYEKRGRRVHYD